MIYNIYNDNIYKDNKIYLPAKFVTGFKSLSGLKAYTFKTQLGVAMIACDGITRQQGSSHH